MDGAEDSRKSEGSTDAPPLPMNLKRAADLSDTLTQRRMLAESKERERRRRLGLEPRTNPMLRPLAQEDKDSPAALLQQLERGGRRDITVTIPTTNEVRVYRRAKTDVKAARRSMMSVPVERHLMLEAGQRKRENLEFAKKLAEKSEANDALQTVPDSGRGPRDTRAGTKLPQNYVRRPYDAGAQIPVDSELGRELAGEDDERRGREARIAIWRTWVTERQELPPVDPNAGRRQRRRVRHHRKSCKYALFSTHRAFRQLSLQTTFPPGTMRQSLAELRQAAHGGSNGTSSMDFHVDDFFAPMNVGWWDTDGRDFAAESSRHASQNIPEAVTVEGPARRRSSATRGSRRPSGRGSQDLTGTQPLTDGDAAVAAALDSDGDTASLGPGSTRLGTSTTASPSHHASPPPDELGFSHASSPDVHNRSVASTAAYSGSPALAGAPAAAPNEEATPGLGLDGTQAAPLQGAAGQAKGASGTLSAQPAGPTPQRRPSRTVFLTEAAGERPAQPSRPVSVMSTRCQTPAVPPTTLPRPHTREGEYFDCSCTDRSTDDELETIGDHFGAMDASAAAEARLDCWRRGFAKTKVLARSRLESRLQERRRERETLLNDRRHFAAVTSDAELQGSEWRVNRQTRSTTPSDASMWHTHYSAMAQEFAELESARNEYVAICDACSAAKFPSRPEEEAPAMALRDEYLRTRRPVTVPFVFRLLTDHAPVLLARKPGVKFIDALRQTVNLPAQELLATLQRLVTRIQREAERTGDAGRQRAVAYEADSLIRRLQKVVGGVAAAAAAASTA